MFSVIDRSNAFSMARACLGTSVTLAVGCLAGDLDHGGVLQDDQYAVLVGQFFWLQMFEDAAEA